MMRKMKYLRTFCALCCNHRVVVGITFLNHYTLLQLLCVQLLCVAMTSAVTSADPRGAGIPRPGLCVTLAVAF